MVSVSSMTLQHINYKHSRSIREETRDNVAKCKQLRLMLIEVMNRFSHIKARLCYFTNERLNP